MKRLASISMLLVTAVMVVFSGCTGGTESVPLPTVSPEELPPVVVALGYTCDDGRPFWISDLGVSFEGAAGPWDPSVSTADAWTFEEVCE